VDACRIQRVRRSAERNAEVYRFAPATGHGRLIPPRTILVALNALIYHSAIVEVSAMVRLLRRQPKLHSIVLVCAVLLLAAQTLALAHVHADEAACAVCAHTDNSTSAGGTSCAFPFISENSAAVPLSEPRRAQQPLLRSFDPRGPPASVL
jgi:hypothetical protein